MKTFSRILIFAWLSSALLKESSSPGMQEHVAFETTQIANLQYSTFNAQ